QKWSVDEALWRPDERALTTFVRAVRPARRVCDRAKRPAFRGSTAPARQQAGSGAGVKFRTRVRSADSLCALRSPAVAIASLFDRRLGQHPGPLLPHRIQLDAANDGVVVAIA